MSNPKDEDLRRTMEEEARKALEVIDKAEREFLAAIQEARDHLDREESEGRARFATTREETQKNISSLLGK